MLDIQLDFTRQLTLAFIGFLCSFYLLISLYRKSAKDYIKKKQIYFMISSTIAFGIGIIVFFIALLAIK